MPYLVLSLERALLARATAMQLASRISYCTRCCALSPPLSNEQIRAAGQYILAEAPIESRSERYSYIPTATMLQDLRGEGFEPF